MSTECLVSICMGGGRRWKHLPFFKRDSRLDPDLDRGLIFKFGKPVVIRHKLFELLAYLVKRSNRVVWKDELI